MIFPNKMTEVILTKEEDVYIAISKLIKDVAGFLNKGENATWLIQSPSRFVKIPANKEAKFVKKTLKRHPVKDTLQ